MLAVSEGLPIKCFAVGVQRHPYAFFSLGKNPIRKPQDMIGKRIGIHATGMVLLRPCWPGTRSREPGQHRADRLGHDALLSGRVDAVAGWQTTSRRSRRWRRARRYEPVGLRRAPVCPALLRAHGHVARSSRPVATLPARDRQRLAPRQPQSRPGGGTAGQGISQPEPGRRARRDRRIHGVRLQRQTKAKGWGSMDPAVWQEQIPAYAQLSSSAPARPSRTS